MPGSNPFVFSGRPIVTGAKGGSLLIVMYLFMGLSEGNVWCGTSSRLTFTQQNCEQDKCLDYSAGKEIQYSFGLRNRLSRKEKAEGFTPGV